MTDFLKLRAFIKPYLGQILLSILNLGGLTALSLYIPRIIRGVIDDGILHSNIAFLGRAALLLLGIGLLTAGMGALMASYLAANPAGTEADALSSALGTLAWISLVATLVTFVVALRLPKTTAAPSAPPATASLKPAGD